jgi:hypothetical protein
MSERDPTRGLGRRQLPGRTGRVALSEMADYHSGRVGSPVWPVLARNWRQAGVTKGQLSLGFPTSTAHQRVAEARTDFPGRCPFAIHPATTAVPECGAEPVDRHGQNRSDGVLIPSAQTEIAPCHGGHRLR